MTFIIFDNHKFIKDNTTGYYHAHYGNTTKLLHRVVWEHFNGTIPEYYHVHHIDKNKDNNDISNLELIECHAHLSEHGKLNFEAKYGEDSYTATYKIEGSPNTGYISLNRHEANVYFDLPHQRGNKVIYNGSFNRVFE